MDSVPACLVILLLVINETTAYSSGPPAGACLTMVPGHYPSTPQTSSPPFAIMLNASTYRTNDVIQVTIRGTGSAAFRGTFIQARRQGSDVSVGTFTVSNNDDHLHTKDCNGNVKSAVSHFRSKDSTSKTFLWTAPSSFMGNITFIGTFVQLKSTFWVDVRSPPLAADTPPGPGTSTNPRVTNNPGATTPSNSSPTVLPLHSYHAAFLACIISYVLSSNVPKFLS